eukprot:g19556.t1
MMLCISSKDQRKHGEAVDLVKGLVEDVYKQQLGLHRDTCDTRGHVDCLRYRSFQELRGRKVEELKVQINEGPRAGSIHVGTMSFGKMEGDASDKNIAYMMRRRAHTTVTGGSDGRQGL